GGRGADGSTPKSPRCLVQVQRPGKHRLGRTDWVPGDGARQTSTHLLPRHFRGRSSGTGVLVPSQEGAPSLWRLARRQRIKPPKVRATPDLRGSFEVERSPKIKNEPRQGALAF